MKNKLIEKKQELEIELVKQVICDADLAEINKEVEDYKAALIEDKKAEYEAARKVIEAKLELLDELIEDADGVEIVEEETPTDPLTPNGLL